MIRRGCRPWCWRLWIEITERAPPSAVCLSVVLSSTGTRPAVQSWQCTTSGIQLVARQASRPARPKKTARSPASSRAG